MTPSGMFLVYFFVTLGFVALIWSLIADLFDTEQVGLHRLAETRPHDMEQALLTKIDNLDKSVVLVTELAEETRLSEAAVAPADAVVSLEEFRARRLHLHDDFHDLEVRIRALERRLQRESARTVA